MNYCVCLRSITLCNCLSPPSSSAFLPHFFLEYLEIRSKKVLELYNYTTIELFVAIKGDFLVYPFPNQVAAKGNSPDTMIDQMLQNSTKKFYAFNERTIFIQRIIYIFNEIIFLIQQIIYVFNGELIFFTCSTIQNFSFRSSKSKDNKLCAEILKLVSRIF